jgi:hypothetical protein
MDYHRIGLMRFKRTLSCRDQALWICFGSDTVLRCPADITLFRTGSGIFLQFYTNDLGQIMTSQLYLVQFTPEIGFIVSKWRAARLRALVCSLYR